MESIPFPIRAWQAVGVITSTFVSGRTWNPRWICAGFFFCVCFTFQNTNYFYALESGTQNRVPVLCVPHRNTRDFRGSFRTRPLTIQKRILRGPHHRPCLCDKLKCGLRIQCIQKLAGDSKAARTSLAHACGGFCSFSCCYNLYFHLSGST